MRFYYQSNREILKHGPYIQWKNKINLWGIDEGCYLNAIDEIQKVEKGIRKNSGITSLAIGLFLTFYNMIYISVGHNDARNWIKDENGKLVLGLYKDQGAQCTSFGVTSTEFQYGKRIVSEIHKLGRYEFVPYGLNLTQRIKWINDRCVDGDMCIELHMDSFPNAQGCSTWYMSGSKYAEDLAKVFQQEYTRVTGIKGRGVHGDLTNRNKRLGFVRDTKCLAFLLEMGFISNSSDRDKVWLKGAEGIDSGLALIGKLV